MSRLLFVPVFVLSASIANSSRAVDDLTLPDGPPPKEGRIYNLDSKPFEFRLARKVGRAWTDPKTLAPGDVYILRTDQSGEAEALEGITRDGSGHVTIEYAELGGRMRIQLPAIDVAKKTYATNWFHVRDSNGFSRVVQAANKEEAEQKHKALLAEPPLTEAELASVKRTLRANFVLYDK